MVEKDLRASLSNLIDVDFLQELQEVFAKESGIAIVIMDENGPITTASNFTDILSEYYESQNSRLKACLDVCVKQSAEAAKKQEPIIYVSKSGLTNFAIPILHKEQHLGTVIGGQVLTEIPDINHFKRIAKELGVDENKYINAIKQTKIVSVENLKSIANLLYFVFNSILNKNLELEKQKEREIIDNRITESILRGLDIEETLSFICEETAKIFGVQRVSIAVYPNANDYKDCTIRKEYKIRADLPGVNKLKKFDEIAEFWAGNILTPDGVIAIDCVKKSSYPDFFKDNYVEMGVRSIIGMGIKKGEDVWGTLILSQYDSHRVWTEDDISLLKAISNQIYLAIKQAELHDASKKIAENEKALRKIISSSVMSADIGEVFNSIVTEAGKLFSADRCLFVHYDFDEKFENPLLGYYEYVSSSNICSHSVILPNRTVNHSTIQHLKDRKVFYSQDVAQAEIAETTRHLLIDELSVKAYLVAPVYYGAIDYGALILHYVQDYKKFTQDEIERIKAIADQSAAVINRAKLYSEIDKNEKYTRAVLDSIKDGIVTIDENFIIESCNPAVENIWGYKPTECVGKSLEMLLEYNCDGKNIKTCLEQKTSMGVRKNGEKFSVEINVSEVNFEDRKAELLVVRDITEQKRVEKMKSEFVSTVSHELRTPLTAIKGSLGLVTSGALGELPEKVTKLVDVANNNCTRLTNLINDILDLEKIKAGKYEFKYEELEINSIIEQSIVLNQSYAEQFGMEFSVKNASEEAFLKADKNRLLQVISNLFSNAVKFSNLGGEVQIRTVVTKDKIKVSFVDKGIGIPEDAKHKIFQSFSQVDSSDTRSKGGTGLGLSICKLIIESMGGEIGFKSKLGKGSTFYFVMPRIIPGSVKTEDGNIKEFNPEDDSW